MAESLVKQVELDDRYVAFQAWIDDELASYRSPRVSDIVKQGRKAGLSAAEVRAHLQRRVPEYRDTTNKIYQAARTPHRLYSVPEQGWIQIDIAFFGKLIPELARINQTTEAGCLVGQDIVTK